MKNCLHKKVRMITWPDNGNAELCLDCLSTRHHCEMHTTEWQDHGYKKIADFYFEAATLQMTIDGDSMEKLAKFDELIKWCEKWRDYYRSKISDPSIQVIEHNAFETYQTVLMKIRQIIRHSPPEKRPYFANMHLCCKECPIKKGHIKCTYWIKQQKGCLSSKAPCSCHESHHIEIALCTNCGANWE